MVLPPFALPQILVAVNCRLIHVVCDPDLSVCPSGRGGCRGGRSEGRAYHCENRADPGGGKIGRGAGRVCLVENSRRSFLKSCPKATTDPSTAKHSKERIRRRMSPLCFRPSGLCMTQTQTENQSCSILSVVLNYRETGSGAVWTRFGTAGGTKWASEMLGG